MRVQASPSASYHFVDFFTEKLFSKTRYIPDESLAETKTLLAYKKTLLKERDNIKMKYKESKFRVIVNDVKTAIEELATSEVQKEITTVRSTSSQPPSIKRLIGLEKKTTNKEKPEDPFNNNIFKI